MWLWDKSAHGTQCDECALLHADERGRASQRIALGYGCDRFV